MYTLNIMMVLITILALGFVIFVHEMGHLIFAKWGGVGVYEFSIGMGPKIWGFDLRNRLQFALFTVWWIC